MALFNILRQDKKTNQKKRLNFNQHEWLPLNNDTICPNILTENNADFYVNIQSRNDNQYYYLKCLNTVKQRTFKIAWIGDNTGNNADLTEDLHKGFTIGKGKAMYWMMIWHKSGNVTVFGAKNNSKRYLSGDQLITVHFK